MGCDIHLHIELKIEGQWHHYAAPSIERWYALFEKMAGVRGETENAIAGPKGLPDDVTLITRRCAEYDEGDAHNHSWLGVKEIVVLEEWCRAAGEKEGFFLKRDLEHSILHTYLLGSSLTGWHRYPEDGNPLKVEDLRFVFWFDN